MAGLEIARRSWAEATTDGGTMDEGIHIDLRAAMHRRSARGYRHGQRVGLLAAAFGDWLGLEAGHVGRLRYAAELHDIAKLALSAELLEKPGARSMCRNDTACVCTPPSAIASCARARRPGRDGRDGRAAASRVLGWLRISVRIERGASIAG